MENRKKLQIVKKLVGQFKKGQQFESEHSSKYGKQFDVTHNNPKLTVKIVGVHLKEIPDYYDRLEKMEDKAKKDKLGKEE